MRVHIDRRIIKELYFQAHIVRRFPNRKKLKITTPRQVLTIDEKADLFAALDHYRREIAGLWFVVPDTHIARRHYVEHVRPALRHYCRRFSIDIPDWLSDDSRYLDRPDEEKLALFGTATLQIREFKRVRIPSL